MEYLEVNNVFKHVFVKQTIAVLKQILVIVKGLSPFYIIMVILLFFVVFYKKKTMSMIQLIVS